MARRRETGQARAETAKTREDHWREVLAKQKRSGLTHAEFCRRESISPPAYFWWKRELPLRDAKKRTKSTRRRKRRTKKNDAVSLVPVTIAAQAPGAAASMFEVVLRNDRVVRVSADFSDAALTRLVDVLERATC